MFSYLGIRPHRSSPPTNESAMHNQCIQPRHRIGRICCLALTVVLLSAGSVHAQSRHVSYAEEPTGRTDGQNTAALADDILNMDIDQLARTPVVVPSMDIPVTSVTKKESTVGRSAAAVFVITPEMIRHSGATCIPEALRMAPGLEVAKIDSSKWAITCRGFNSRYANKLLVLIDGRSVYTPVYSGVEWDMQDVLMEDIERIEVIRGPGSTLWGANAVNGVISIITKRAKDTQGAYVMAGGGTYEKLFEGVRYGGTIGENIHYRFYGKHFERAPGYDPTGPNYDGWAQGRAGFRMDYTPECDDAFTFTLQGDCFTGGVGSTSINTLTVPPYERTLYGQGQISGENLLARWRRVYDKESDLTLQLYYDHYCRKQLVLTEDVRTFDIDLQYRFPLGDRHSITCGAGARNQHEYVPSKNYFTIHFTPPETTITTTSQFVQDAITIVEDRIELTLGCKLEQNPYTGLEYQPSIRMLFTPDRKHTFWGAVSRAVRTPSYYEEAFTATAHSNSGIFPRINGSRAMRSEEMVAYELGYRTQATDNFSWDVATFYNHYGLLATVFPSTPYPEFNPPPPHMILPFYFTNGPTADTYGVELATDLKISDRWRLHGQYTYFHMSMLNNPGTDPSNQVYLDSTWKLGENVDFDLIARYVDSLPGIGVKNYITMDMRLGWRPRENFELAFVGQNLLQPYHLEFGSTYLDARTQVTEVPRGVYGTATWRR